jgi:ectoine hydroxylase-related dioxygenase (phytanoyl-CoA dioxygenase family)
MMPLKRRTVRRSGEEEMGSAVLPSALSSNGYDLDCSPARLGWLEPSDPAEDLAALRSRYDTDGYLWLRSLLPRTAVLEFRRHVFAQFAELGLLATGSDPVEGRTSDRPSDPASRGRLMELVRSAAFESFCLMPELWRFVDRLIGGNSTLHRRKILRFTRPGDPASTGAHYDLIYLRAGTDRLVTAWIPIGDVPVRMGGLLYLEGSHRLGREMEAEFGRKNVTLSPQERISAYNRNMTETGWISKDLPAMAERFGTRWLAADYAAGDVVLHSPTMIHAATRNDDPGGIMRLSADIRFQDVRDEADPRWGGHWTLKDGL